MKILITIDEEEEIKTDENFPTKFDVIKELIKYGGLHYLNSHYEIKEVSDEN